MTTLQMAIVERHPGERVVFNVRVQTDADKLEFPMSGKYEGTQAKNETAALRRHREFPDGPPVPFSRGFWNARRRPRGVTRSGT